jgi:hypothetical protein
MYVLEGVLAQPHRQDALEHVHVVQVTMSVERRSREAWLRHRLAEIEGAGGVFAGRLDRDGRRAADVLALAGAVDYCHLFVSFSLRALRSGIVRASVFLTVVWLGHRA